VAADLAFFVEVEGGSPMHLVIVGNENGHQADDDTVDSDLSNQSHWDLHPGELHVLDLL
jgi:hypothetical protein